MAGLQPRRKAQQSEGLQPLKPRFSVVAALLYNDS